MNSSKLGLQLTSSVLALALATTVGVMPVGDALAGAPATDEDEIEVGSPADDDGDEIEIGDPDDGDEIEIGAPEESDEIEIDIGMPEEPGEAEDELPEADELSIGDDDDDDDLMTMPEGPQRPSEPTWGPKDHPRNGKGMLATGGVVTGLGAAFIVTAMLITRCDYDSELRCKYGDQRDFLVPTAVATTGLGLLLIGVGVSNRVKYKRWQNWSPETAVVPTFTPDGGGLAWVGRF
jgi:hypothetical protein